MARVGVVALSLVVVLLGAGLPRPAAAKTQVFLSKLPKSLVVSVSPKHGDVLHAGDDKLTVTWSPNATAGSDAAFKSVKVKLCYAPASRTDRGWRKANDDLHKDKACQFKVTVQPYAAGAGGNGTFDYVVARDIPTASYFVRAYAVDESGTEVAYGQSSPDAAFDVAGITGIHTSLKVAAGVFSTFSIAALAFFFVVEKRKKDK
uniref:High-affinity nitrate transporter n=1 Tax=Leersia perrieri TaxID=77586 RepID=A0A0D9VHT7_9ORYZ